MQEMETGLKGPLTNPYRRHIQISIVNAVNGWVVTTFSDSCSSKTFVALVNDEVSDIVYTLLNEFNAGRDS